jgi:hypothetical protein
MNNKNIDALKSLRPNTQWILRGQDIEWEEILDEEKNPTGQYENTNFEWRELNIDIPSKEEIEAEVIRLDQQWIATEYQRLRQPEYPPLADLADALYWQSQGDESKMTAYLAAVDAVKQKYPKEGE